MPQLPFPTTILTTSLLYTSLVFSAGFLCGLIRVPLLEPYLGERRAQVLEMPFMGLAIWKAAWYTVGGLRRNGDGSKKVRKAGAIDDVKEMIPNWVYWILGAFSFIQILGLEIGWFLFRHRGEGKGVVDWIEEKDPIAGTVFLGALVFFGIAPGLVGELGGGDGVGGMDEGVGE